MEGLDTSRLEELKKKVHDKLEQTELFRFKGTVSKLLGLTVEVKLPGLKVGDLCYIETKDGRKKPAEVQAFKGEAAQLLLLYDGEGIGQGSLVTSTGKPIIIPVGDFLLGRLINPMGEPIDGKPILQVLSGDLLRGLRRGLLKDLLLRKSFQLVSER